MDGPLIGQMLMYFAFGELENEALDGNGASACVYGRIF